MSGAGVKERLLAWVDDRGELDPVSKFILYKLAQFADAECCGWAKVKTLAVSVNVSERTVQTRLRDLENAGLIERTGKEHMTEGRYPRPVPIYRLAPGVKGLDDRPIWGANSAPETDLGCKDSRFGVQLAAPVYEPKEPTEESDDSSERARDRDATGQGGPGRGLEAVFAAIEAAYPQKGLGFTVQEQAWAALIRLFETGVDVAALPAAAARYAADPILKKRDFGPVGLQRWLGEGRYRGWLEPAPQAAEPGVAGAVAQAALPADVAEVFEGKTAPWRASWLSGAVWREADRTLALRTGMAVATVERELGPALRAAGITLTRAPPSPSPQGQAPSVANASQASSQQDPS